MRIGVISHSQKHLRPERYVSKNAASALVRRLLAVHISKHLIQMVEVKDVCRALPADRAARSVVIKQYEHHIEPRIEMLNVGNSEWMAYLQGFQKYSRAEL